MTAPSLEEFNASYTQLIAQLYGKAVARLPFLREALPQERFAAALHRSGEQRFRESAAIAAGGEPEAELAAYLESLYVEDLALACACSEGNEQAWEYLVRHYRQSLYSAARAIIGHTPAGRQAEGGSAGRGSPTQARDLADSIYAELYGLEQRDGQRRSLLDYFHGRSKLSTWLRAVLAQRHVDALRAGQRTESFEEADTPTTGLAPSQGPRGSPVSLDPDRARYLVLLQAALLDALAALSPRDRLRLAFYYVQELTLAQIGRILGEHEATVSRHLDRTRRELRKQVECALRAGQASTRGGAPARGLSDAQIRLCFEYAMEEWPFDLTSALSRETSGPKRNLPGPVREEG